MLGIAGKMRRRCLVKFAEIPLHELSRFHLFFSSQSGFTVDGVFDNNSNLCGLGLGGGGRAFKEDGTDDFLHPSGGMTGNIYNIAV